MEQARTGKQTRNMNGRETTRNIDMGSEIGSHARQNSLRRENRYSQGLASDIQAQGGLLDEQTSSEIQNSSVWKCRQLRTRCTVVDQVASCKSSFTAQPKAPAHLKAGASGWAVND
jgi:hypothetical protein